MYTDVSGLATISYVIVKSGYEILRNVNCLQYTQRVFCCAVQCTAGELVARL
jgi:hypothetical protein